MEADDSDGLLSSRSYESIFCVLGDLAFFTRLSRQVSKSTHTIRFFLYGTFLTKEGKEEKACKDILIFCLFVGYGLPIGLGLKRIGRFRQLYFYEKAKGVLRDAFFQEGDFHGKTTKENVFFREGDFRANGEGRKKGRGMTDFRRGRIKGRGATFGHGHTFCFLFLFYSKHRKNRSTVFRRLTKVVSVFVAVPVLVVYVETFLELDPSVT